MEHVPYKGASEVMTGMLSGSVEVMFVTPPSVMGLIKVDACGRSPSPAPNRSRLSERAPDEGLLPGFEPMGSWGVFLAPGKLPEAIVDKLNEAIRER